MISDYECSRCHNKFPESNKIMHDLRCTEENPLPNNENKIPIPQNKPQLEEDEKIIKDSDVFECNICHMVMSVVEKNDHMLCHNLEKEEKNKQKKLRQIAEQKKIQKEIEKRNKQKKFIEQQRQIERQIQLNNRNNQQHHIQNNNQRQNNNNGNLGRNENIGINMINNNLSNLRNAIQNNNVQINRPNSHSNNTHNNLIQNQIQNINRMMMNHNNMNNHAPIHHRPQNLNNLIGNNRFVVIIGNNFHHNHNHRNHFPESRHEHPTDKQILNQLPETKIEDVNKLDSEKKNCVICLEDFKNGDKAVLLPCIHMFHTKCIKNWLKTQNSCPICKFKLTAQNMNSQ